jgi:hypothetical protein
LHDSDQRSNRGDLGATTLKAMEARVAAELRRAAMLSTAAALLWLPQAGLVAWGLARLGGGDAAAALPAAAAFVTLAAVQAAPISSSSSSTPTTRRAP